MFYNRICLDWQWKSPWRSRRQARHQNDLGKAVLSLNFLVSRGTSCKTRLPSQFLPPMLELMHGATRCRAWQKMICSRCALTHVAVVRDEKRIVGRSATSFSLFCGLLAGDWLSFSYAVLGLTADTQSFCRVPTIPNHFRNRSVEKAESNQSNQSPISGPTDGTGTSSVDVSSNSARPCV